MKNSLYLTLLCLIFTNCLQTKEESKAMNYSAMTTFTANPEGKIKLFSYKNCPWCKKVIAFLQQQQNLDKVVILEVDKPAHMQELLKLTNGNTQCPYLSDEIKGIGMHESADIIQYFTTRF